MILLTGHFERAKAKKALGKASAALKKLNADFEASNIREKKFNSKKFGCIIAIGGDGALLRVARELKNETPIVGIASGEKNFLMQIKQNKIRKALEKIVSGKIVVEERTRLQAIADGKKLLLALNEVLLVNKKSGALIKYCIKVNGKKIAENSGDGVIIATPTGSTGHALSAGGKKIFQGIEIVQYNVLGGKHKPIIANANAKIEIKCFNDSGECEAVIDGQPRFKARKSIIIKRGKSIKFVKLK